MTDLRQTDKKYELYRTKVLAMLMHTQDSEFAKSGEFPDAPDLIAIFACRMGARDIFIQKKMAPLHSPNPPDCRPGSACVPAAPAHFYRLALAAFHFIIAGAID